jgi:hypothetical protein
MIILSRDECEKWFAKRDIYLGGPSSTVAADNYPNHISFAMPSDAGRLNALSTQFPELSGINAGILWITNFGVFPSCQNLPLFYGYRNSLNELRSLADAPGHVFERHERDEFCSILNMCVIFFWDFLIADTDATCLVSVSHDEHCTLCAREGLQLDDIISNLREFGLEIIEAR